MAVLVGPGEAVSAAHVVDADTDKDWRDASDWLRSGRTSEQRSLLRLVGDETAVLRLSMTLTDALAAGWTIQPEQGATATGDGLFDEVDA